MQPCRIAPLSFCDELIEGEQPDCDPDDQLHHRPGVQLPIGSCIGAANSKFRRACKQEKKESGPDETWRRHTARREFHFRSIVENALGHFFKCSN